MLTKLRLKNFKLHADTQLEAARITVLIGPNNSGKSSLFQALLLLRQATSRGRVNLCDPVQRQQTSPGNPYLFPEHQLVDVGDFEDVVRRGERQIELIVVGSVNRAGPAGLLGPLEADFGVEVRENRIVAHGGSIKYQSPRYGVRGSSSWEWVMGAPPKPVNAPWTGAGEIVLEPSDNFRLLGSFTLRSTGSLSRESALEIQEVAQQLANAPLTLLTSLHPVLPLRGLEESGSPLTESPAQNVERMSLADRTVALLSVLAYDPDLQEKLSRWLEELIQVRIRVKLLPGRRVTLLTTPPDRGYADSLFANEGTGASQLPFILVPIGLTPPGETVLVCEPEAHLHPKAQSSLVSLLLTIAKKEDRQFFIETHSEHVLHSLLCALASGELSRTELAIYYFERENGTAACRKLEIDEKGRVDGGLPGFFEHSLAELSEYLDALKKS